MNSWPPPSTARRVSIGQPAPTTIATSASTNRQARVTDRILIGFSHDDWALYSQHYSLTVLLRDCSARHQALRSRPHIRKLKSGGGNNPLPRQMRCSDFFRTPTPCGGCVSLSL